MIWPFTYARGNLFNSVGLYCGLLISIATFAMRAIIAKWTLFARTLKLAPCVLKLMKSHEHHIF